MFINIKLYVLDHSLPDCSCPRHVRRRRSRVPVQKVQYASARRSFLDHENVIETSSLRAVPPGIPGGLRESRNAGESWCVEYPGGEAFSRPQSTRSGPEIFF